MFGSMEGPGWSVFCIGGKIGPLWMVSCEEVLVDFLK